jgi:predicted metal-dependent peptidase
MDHVSGASRGEGLDRDLANIAMDIAINQFIPSDLLPPGALLPAKYGLASSLSFEEYYLELLKRKDQPKDKALDNHSYTIGDSDQSQDSESSAGQSQKGQLGQGQGQGGLSAEMQKAAIQGVISSAIQSVGAGNIPLHVKSMLPDTDAVKSKIRWTNFLRKYMGRYLSNEVQSTRNRPNRRLGFKAQGTKREDAPKAMFGFDESGSMSDSDLQSVASEARHILKALSEKTEVVHFDTKIAHIEKLSKITTITRHAQGGTDFTPLVEYANSKGVDLLVILSDGDGPMKVKPKMPVIWIMPDNFEIKHKGEKISLK